MKKVVFFIVAILLLIAVPVTVYFVGTQQELRSKAAPATRLSFSPATITKQQGESFTVNVQIDTAENTVAAAKIVVTFDATKLEATSITNGPFAPKIAASGVVAYGIASITVAAENSTQPIQGTGTIAVIRFTGKQETTTPTSLQFDTTTFISGLNETTNVLTTTSTASISVTANGQAATTIPTIPPTIIPIITPIPTDMASNQATSSAVTITVKPDASGNISTTPEISGTATAGSTITAVIHPETITMVVTTNTSGIWQFIPNTALTDGEHTITVTATNLDDSTETASLTFIVSSAGIGGASSDAMPTSGNTETTLLFLVIGTSCIICSGAFQILLKKQI